MFILLFHGWYYKLGVGTSLPERIFPLQLCPYWWRLVCWADQTPQAGQTSPQIEHIYGRMAAWFYFLFFNFLRRGGPLPLCVLWVGSVTAVWLWYWRLWTVLLLGWKICVVCPLIIVIKELFVGIDKNRRAMVLDGCDFWKYPTENKHDGIC